jgi:hypothetical protein
MQQHNDTIAIKKRSINLGVQDVIKIGIMVQLKKTKLMLKGYQQVDLI